jgi:hypothetical protein
MRVEALHTAGLSGDLGWNEAEDLPTGGLSTALLILATGVVWGSVWLLSGLPPLSSVASRVGRQVDSDHLSASEPAWRDRPA